MSHSELEHGPMFYSLLLDPARQETRGRDIDAERAGLIGALEDRTPINRIDQGKRRAVSVEEIPDGMVFHLDQGIDRGGLQLRV